MRCELVLVNERRSDSDRIRMCTSALQEDVFAYLLTPDGLTDCYQEILGLLRDRGEGLQDNMTILRVDPDGSSGVVGPQMKPREIALPEDMRD